MGRERRGAFAQWPGAAGRGGSLLIALALVAGGCGSLPFLGGDLGAPQSRAARFDRFERELAMGLADTAPPMERLRREAQLASALGGPIASTAPRWSGERRLAARRTLTSSALDRLTEQFPPARLDAQRATAARALLLDLRRELDLEDADEIPSREVLESAGRARLDPMTPWRGAILQAPSILAREQPARSEADIARWLGELDRMAFEPVDLSDLSPRVYIEAFGPRAVHVAAAVTDDLARMAAAAGTGDVSDPFIGPLGDAVRALPAPQADRFVGRSRQRMLRALQSRVSARLGAARTLLRQLEGRRDQTTVSPLDGAARERWIRRLKDAAGPQSEVSGLDGLARMEIERLGLELGAILGVPSPQDGRALRDAFDAVRTGAREIPGSAPGLPDAIWALAAEDLASWVADVPDVLVTARTARTFERPHGRWSPFVRGDLAPGADPAARGAIYLAPRQRDPSVPLWLHDAEALRHGIPGEALLDAFRREAVATPLHLRVTQREAFAGGWGLYAAAACVKEGGVDLGDDGFGVTAQELAAFVALAVDVGLHDRGWSHRQALDAVLQWTPLPEFAAKELVLRSICDPGRAALPAIGLLRFRALRTTIAELLGDDFDPASFHAALLRGGPIPMGEIDARVDRWLQLRGRAPRRP